MKDSSWHLITLGSLEKEIQISDVEASRDGKDTHGVREYRRKSRLIGKEVGYGERLGDKLFSDMLNYT